MFSRPKKLYKYLSVEGANAMLASPAPELWFRLQNRLNDPYDMKPIGSHMDVFGAIGVFCMSESPTSAPMWAHYASNGEGIALEFSINSDFFQTYPLAKVNYSSRRPTVKNPGKALTTKSREWKYEKEWRCFVAPPASKEGPTQLLIHEQAISVPLDLKSVTAIIHGPDCQVVTSKFFERSDAKHIQEFVCRTNAWKYGFGLRKLDDLDYMFEQSDAVQWGRRNLK
jgi:hypothetical protein